MTPGSDRAVTRERAVSPAHGAPDRSLTLRGSDKPMTQAERDRVLQSPFVREVMDVFNARVIDIRPDRAAPPESTESPDTGPPQQDEES